jgi:DNA polymerase-1
VRNPRYEEFASPLATDVGKQAIIKAFFIEGVKEGALPTTPGTGKLATGREPMLELKEKIIKYGGNPKLERMIDLIISVVGERTVYDTINSTRVDDRVHPSIKPSQASGRWSITGPGLTVLGKRGGRHVERRVLLPEIGHSNMSVDLRQVDARAVAAHSQDRNYMRIFQEGRDLHTANAITAFGDGSRREDAKPVGHGWNYGLSIRRMIEMGLTESAACAFDENMRANHPGVIRWQNNVRQIARDGGLLDNGWGRMMRPDPRFAYTQAPALVGQGCTRDILAEGLLRLPVEIWPMLRVVVHDEIVMSVPTESYHDVAEVVREALSFDFRGVPIECDVSKPGSTWAAVYDK